MALINCPNCGKEISDESIFCSYCGFKLDKEITTHQVSELNAETALDSQKEESEQEESHRENPVENSKEKVKTEQTSQDEKETSKKKSWAVPIAILVSCVLIFGVCGFGLASTYSRESSNQSYTESESKESSNSSSKNSAEQKKEVAVADFSGMDRDAIRSWCKTNNLTSVITEEYSDTVGKGLFVSQSVPADTNVTEGTTIRVVFSLGKKPTTEQTNALKKAQSYANNMHMSKQGVYDQLTSAYGEGFSAEAAQYAVDNVSADWNANALEKAKTYQSRMSMSKSRIYEQLTSQYGEQFTASEAQYAIDNLPD